MGDANLLLATGCIIASFSFPRGGMVQVLVDLWDLQRVLYPTVQYRCGTVVAYVGSPSSISLPPTNLDAIFLRRDRHPRETND